MINVLFIGMTPNPGGLETYMINIFSKLEGEEFHFNFLNVYHKQIAYYKYILNNNGTIVNLPLPINDVRKHLDRYRIAINFFNHHSYDIIHVNALTLNNIFWIKAADKCGLKHLILQSHNCGIEYSSKIIAYMAHFLFLYNQKYLQSHNNIIRVAASYECGKWMFNRMPFKVINNGIYTNPYLYEPNNRVYFRKRIGISIHDKVIITTARLWKQKNYPKIIHIFNIINKIKNNIRLLIIGSGPDYKYILNMVNHYKLYNHVKFLGQQSKRTISKLLSVADLMLMPSLHEAVPFSLTEAQAAGVPALVSLNAIPKEADITGKVEYLSLKQSDYKWAIKALNILHHPLNIHEKQLMNKYVKDSEYNVDNAVNKVKYMYKRCLNNI